MEALVIDIRLSIMEPTDIKGIPIMPANDNTMKWAPPLISRCKTGKKT